MKIIIYHKKKSAVKYLAMTAHECLANISLLDTEKSFQVTPHS